MSDYALYFLAIGALIFSYYKDRAKTLKALKVSYKSIMKLMPAILPMMFFIGISLSVLSEELISQLLGAGSGIVGMLIAFVVGALAFMPSFVAFPLGANLLEHGAGYPQIAAFVSSLMGVGVASLGVEMKYFGKRAAFLRNAVSVLASICFAMIIWRVM
ncbi:permease [Fusibacter paucivorans]|uniref:Permease n=1 Tax=Fusibacter paucivorans TaxID=76009 RepID=A0ABS5PVT5_9FIRM|nr:permease [Fusibacter paucivorans]MBS7528679.1 permease [Fusibacter paucivorans]